MDAMERYIFPTYIWRKTKTQHNQKFEIEIAFHPSKVLGFFYTGINNITVDNHDDVITCTFHLAIKFGVLYTYNEVIIPGTTYQHQHRRLQIK